MNSIMVVGRVVADEDAIVDTIGFGVTQAQEDRAAPPDDFFRWIFLQTARHNSQSVFHL